MTTAINVGSMVDIDHRYFMGRFIDLVKDAMAKGEHVVDFMTQGLIQRAAEIDSRYRDLDLGFVDAALMSYAERHDLPILTFDFEDFRAAAPESGYWRLAVDEE